MLRAIVKVGKSSSIKFRGVNLLRAITLKEVSSLIEVYDDISFIVLEDLDITKEKDFVVNTLNNYATTMVVYKQEITDKEKEICEDIGIGYADDLKSVYSYIESNIGEYVGIYPKENSQENGLAEIIEETEQEDYTDNDVSLKSIFDDEDEDIAELDKSLRDLDEAFELTKISDEQTEEVKEQKVENKNIVYKEELESSSLEDELFKDFEEQVKDNKSEIEELDSEVENKIVELEDTNSKLNDRLEYANEQVRKLNEVRISLEEELEEYKNKLKDIYIEDEVKEVIIGKNVEQEYKERVAELELTVQSLSDKALEVSELKEEIDKLNQSLDNKNKEIQSLNSNINDFEQKKYSEKLNLEIKSRLRILDLLNRVLDRTKSLEVELRKEIDNKDEIIDNYEELKVLYEKDNKTIKQLKEEKEELIKERDNAESKANTKLAELKNKVSSINVEKIELEAELESAKSKIGEKENKIKSLNVEIATNNQIIADNQKLIQGQHVQLSKYKSFDIDGLKKQLENAKVQLDKQKKEIERLRENNLNSAKELLDSSNKDKNSLLVQVNKYKQLSEELNNENSSLKYELELEKNKNQRIVSKGSYTSDLICDYNAKGYIIPVYGGGSYGVTTTVMSIAYKLEGKVLIMDLDAVAPKIESWVKKKPYIDNADGIANRMNATCFGAILYKSVDYFLDRERSFMQIISNTKNGEISYFSGCYTGVSYKQVESVDWSQLMNTLGSEYDYIIVDLGRLGGSEAGTSLIKMFNRISFNDVAVALHSDGDVRSMIVRMQTAKLNRDKIVWLLNMAENNRLTETMKKSIGNSKYLIMSKYMPIYNKLKRYDSAGMLKATLSELVNRVLE